ncbi:unnamed protein product [Rhizophagus irregularis]|nr:unnamed protein product [Rhizophagus irregularis]
MYNNNNSYELNIQPEDEKNQRRCEIDLIDNITIRKRTFECSHAYTYDSDKAILEENRRDRNSEMIRCLWHVNMAFSKTAKGVQINSIISEHNHSLNPLIIETAPKFQRLTNEMLEKIKFWIIEGKMKMSNQYNLLVAFFSDKTINRKDLIDTTSRTNQFDMILLLFTVVNNNFRNLIVAVALLEDETEVIFTWIKTS